MRLDGLMRIFIAKPFVRFAKRERICNAALLDSVYRAEQGLIDADFGGGVIKQRIARSGQGKSGGYRTIILFRSGERAFFVYGFAKNERDNITKQELDAFRALAREMLALEDKALGAAIANGTIQEIMRNA